MTDRRIYKLIGPDGWDVISETPGQLGGHRRTGVYGRFDCASALDAIGRGGSYKRHRVFFADEATAISAGYRPCGRCMVAEYRAWKASQQPATQGAGAG